MSRLIYAGIGARKTPSEHLREMTLCANQLARDGWILRSGGAMGADTAFENGAPANQREIMIPWSRYNNKVAGPGFLIPEITPQVVKIAKDHHPNFLNLSPTVKQFMFRNVNIILGANLDEHVRMVICWTPLGRATGGTGHAMRIASTYGIPVFNIALREDIPILEEFANAQTN